MSDHPHTPTHPSRPSAEIIRLPVRRRPSPAERAAFWRGVQHGALPVRPIVEWQPTRGSTGRDAVLGLAVVVAVASLTAWWPW